MKYYLYYQNPRLSRVNEEKRYSLCRNFHDDIHVLTQSLLSPETVFDEVDEIWTVVSLFHEMGELLKRKKEKFS